MFDLTSPAPPYHVPKIHLSARLLDQVSHMGKDSPIFFVVVRELVCPRAKLVIRDTLRHVIIAIIDEAMRGFSTEFCEAMLRSVVLEFFAPITRQKDWKLVPVVELEEYYDHLLEVWADCPDSMTGARQWLNYSVELLLN